MTKYLTIEQVIAAHRRGLEEGGGSDGLRDRGALESAVAQPMMAFAGLDLYPTLIDKAGALGFSLILNHPFVDGNKRAGFLAMDGFLRINGHKIAASPDDAESMILAVAAGDATREELIEWLGQHCVRI